jgi:hypothetical protein
MKATREREHYTFILCHESDNNIIRDQQGNFRRYPISLSIPAETTAIDEAGDIRTIRYIPGQKSIYKDEQKIDSDRNIVRLISKPSFQNGILIVPRTQKNLIEFLRKHPANEDNQEWRFPGQRSMFREHNPEVLAKKQNEQTRTLVNAVKLVYEAPFREKLVPLAKYLGYDVNRESDLILYDMQVFAQNNPQDFVELIDSAVVQRHDEVMTADERGIIRVQTDRITWPDGRQIVAVPANYDPFEYFSEVTFDQSHRATWMEIQRKLNRQTDATTAKDDLVEASRTALSVDLEGMRPLDLYEAAIELGVIEQRGPFMVFQDQKHKGKAKMIEAIETSEEFRKLIIATVSSLI